jgi:L-rhamnose mutarotase
MFQAERDQAKHQRIADEMHQILVREGISEDSVWLLQCLRAIHATPLQQEL